MPANKRQKTKYPGVYFIESESPSGRGIEKIYYIRYRKNGKLVEEKAGRQFQDDMSPAKASNLRARKLLGNVPSNNERRTTKRWTIDELWEEYTTSRNDLKRLDSLEYAYNLHLRDRFGSKCPKDLKPSDFDKARRDLSKSLKPSSVHKYLKVIRQIVNHGVYQELCSPLTFKIQFPKYDDSKTEDLTPEQLSRLMAVLEVDQNQVVATIMKLALYTGMRKSEILRLQWSDIDFEKGFILLRDTKGVINQNIPLNKLTRQLLSQYQKSDNSPYVFPAADGSMRHRNSFVRALQRIKKAADLPDDFRPLHGLRHVYASALASSGKVDMYTLQKLLTHKSPQMTQRYAHLRDEALKRAADVADEIFGE